MHQEGWGGTISAMATLPSYPPDDPATVEGESFLADPEIRARVEEGTSRALKGEPGISEREVWRRLSAVPGFTEALAEIEESPDAGGL